MTPTDIPRNPPDSSRYKALSRANLNRPVGELVCPRCEGRTIRRDTDTSDHPPGCFVCLDCNESILA